MPGGACRAAYGAATEVMVGAATRIPIMGANADVRADFKAALDGSGVPVGFAGSMGLEGEVGIDNLKVTKAAFGFGFGAGDGYLYGKAAGKMDIGAIKAAAEGRFFVGRTCDLGILQAVDPLVLEVLGQTAIGASVNATEPVYGSYGYGEGSFSVLSLIGIPPTCMLDLRAGGGMGAFGFDRADLLETPPDSPPPQPARTLVLSNT